jgi:hypothetical protein
MTIGFTHGTRPCVTRMSDYGCQNAGSNCCSFSCFILDQLPCLAQDVCRQKLSSTQLLCLGAALAVHRSPIGLPRLGHGRSCPSSIRPSTRTHARTNTQKFCFHFGSMALLGRHAVQRNIIHSLVHTHSRACIVGAQEYGSSSVYMPREVLFSTMNVALQKAIFGGALVSALVWVHWSV